MEICLRSAAVWLPETFMDAGEIAALSGLPEAVVRGKLGIVRKCRAGAELHPSEMAIRAARQVLDKVAPDSVDLLIWSGGEYKDYPIWSAGIYVQAQLGLERAWSFDLGARCSSNVVALKVAKSMMLADPQLKRVLICGGHRTGDLVNFTDPKTRFLANLSDGGSAMLLERDRGNPIGDSRVLTDGAFSEEVILPAGGTRHPIRDGVDRADTFLRVPEEAMVRRRLASQTLANFVQVIQEAAGGQTIDYLALLHIKRSAHQHILERLGLAPEQSLYLDHFGHFGAPDQIVSLGLAERAGLLRPGALVILAAAGIGYTWSATALRWQGPCFVSQAMLDLHQPT